MRGSYAPTRPEDQSRRRRCATCGAEFFAKRTGRKRKYCSNSCRDTHRRQLNFQFFGSARYPVKQSHKTQKIRQQFQRTAMLVLPVEARSIRPFGTA